MKLSPPLQGLLLSALVLVGGSSPPPVFALEVEYAGCQALLLPGPVCRLFPSRQLSLWLAAAPDAQVEIRAAGSRIDAAGELVQDGQRLSLILPAEAKRVDVLVDSPEGRASWSLALAEPEGKEFQSRLARQAPAHDVLRHVDRTTSLVYDDIVKRRFAAVRETLAGLRLPPGSPAESRFQVTYYHGLLAEMEGDYRSALAGVQKAAEIAERVKLERQQWLAEEMLALLLRKVGRAREAAQLFERLRQTPHPADSCEEAQILNNHAWSVLLAREAGESFGDPTPLFEQALTTYETCKRFTPEMRLNIWINLALAHLQEGRLEPAKDLLARTHELAPHPAPFHTLWRLDLEARIALCEDRPVESLGLFDDLEKLAVETTSPDGRLRAAFGQAQAYEALGDRAAALETLQEAEALLDEQSLQIPVQEGRETFMAMRQSIVSRHIEILLDRGRTAEALTVARHARSRMLRQLERSDRLANLAPDRRARWERLLTEYQERRTALEERAQDDWKLPEDELRREQAARRAEAKAIKEILDQAFLALDVSGEPRDATLPPPRRGELILIWSPLSRGWIGFAADGETIATHHFDLPAGVLPQPAELARRLLLPFRAAIEKAERIRILPSGPLQGVDVHALPFAGDILLASRPVVYGLDLPVPSEPARSMARHALLVADPRDDLPGALDEGRTVRKALEAGSRPWITEELKSAEASAETVRKRLAAADLLHYAGHGTFSGFGGWDSSLLLAGETRLTLGDLLALERVPAWVVLSSCNTGRASTEIPVESLGLAHAFLLAGSRAVVASTRPAADRTTPAFFAELYRQWTGEPDDLAVAFQRAQLAWRQRNPREDWPGFRLFEP